MTNFSGRIRFGIVSGLSIAVMASATAWATEYKVDRDHSHVGFTVRHIVSRVPGEFKDFSGEFNFDSQSPSNDKVKFVVQTSTISTDNEKRDAHLKSPAFFDVARYPTMTFDSTKVTSAGHDKYRIQGKLTLHGVTRPVIFDVDYLGTAKDPWGNTRSGFTATTVLNRKDYGMVWNKTLDAGGLMVGDKVDVKLDIEAVEQAQAKSAAAADKAEDKGSVKKHE